MSDLKAFIDEQIKSHPVEATILRKLYNALAANGTPIVKAYDGGEWVRIQSLNDLYYNAFDLDELTVYTDEDQFVFLVMDSSAPYEMICDYNMSLDEALDPVHVWISDNEDD